MRLLTRLLPTLFALFQLGCDQPAPPRASSATASASAPSTPKRALTPRPSARGSGPLSVPLGIAWSEPDGWVKQPAGVASPADPRRVTYRVPKVDGDPDDAEVSVLYFGKSMGGNLNANLQRWAGQFGKAAADGKLTEQVAGELGLTVFDIQGTLQPRRGTGPRAPKPGFAMVGVVVKTKATGNYFFKLVGPERTVFGARPKFLSLVEGIREVPPKAE